MTHGRSYSREFAPSPQFSFTNTGVTISTTTAWDFEIETEEPTAQKYLPMTDIEIINNSSGRIKFHPNMNTLKKIIIPAGTIKTLDRADIPAIVSGRFLMVSGTASSEEIEVTVWKRGITQDEVARQKHEQIFKKGGSLF